MNKGMINKEDVRKELIQKRVVVDKKDKKSKKISKKLFRICSSFNVIGLYAAKEEEVSVDQIIKTLLRKRKIVLLPKVNGDEISFYQINSLDDISEENSKFHIREPIFLENEYKKEDIEMLVIPGVAFDISGNRLGYGKGYYDRYLKDFSGLKVGVCFEDFLVSEIPTDKEDIKMDLVISEKNTIIRYGQDNLTNLKKIKNF